MLDNRFAGGLALLPSGNVMAAGGVSYKTSRYPASTEVWDAAADAWHRTAPMHVVRSSFAMTPLANGSVVVAGGWDGNTTVLSAEMYNEGEKVGRTPPLGNRESARGHLVGCFALQDLSAGCGGRLRSAFGG